MSYIIKNLKFSTDKKRGFEIESKCIGRSVNYRTKRKKIERRSEHNRIHSKKLFFHQMSEKRNHLGGYLSNIEIHGDKLLFYKLKNPEIYPEKFDSGFERTNFASKSQTFFFSKKFVDKIVINKNYKSSICNEIPKISMKNNKAVRRDFHDLSHLEFVKSQKIKDLDQQSTAISFISNTDIQMSPLSSSFASDHIQKRVLLLLIVFLNICNALIITHESRALTRVSSKLMLTHYGGELDLVSVSDINQGPFSSADGNGFKITSDFGKYEFSKGGWMVEAGKGDSFCLIEENGHPRSAFSDSFSFNPDTCANLKEIRFYIVYDNKCLQACGQEVEFVDIGVGKAPNLDSSVIFPGSAFHTEKSRRPRKNLGSGYFRDADPDKYGNQNPNILDVMEYNDTVDSGSDSRPGNPSLSDLRNSCSLFTVRSHPCQDLNFNYMFNSSILARPLVDNLRFLKAATGLVNDNGIRGLEDTEWQYMI